MENIGALAILLAFCLAIYAVVGSVTGKLKRNPFLIVSAERAVYGVWFLVSLASAVLLYALLTSDFRFSFVAEESNRAMPAIYKFTAWWGGQAGSLLFWSWLLATYASVVIFTNRRRHRDFMPYVVAVLATVQTFFLILNAFIATPFRMLAVDKAITAVADGNGLNPLLQYPAMAIHPPMLYLGYVGFAVPFAFAIGSLITRQPGDGWIHTTRRWTMVTWLFQSCGIVLGAGWAYHVLGWGGYWGWDPVENASLLPWLGGTAFLHSVMMQEKKGMMKVWNIVLVSATFFLCIFGTFLTRSGVVNSVHAFASGPIGKWFVGFLAIGIAATICLILDRLDYLKSEAQLEAVISRESSFMFNNLVLLASCFAVLWGTLFPVISEYATGEKISLDKEWFNQLMIPIGLFLLILTGVGPLFAWRRTSTDSLRRNFMWPGILSLALVAALIAAGMRHFYALISFGFCLFVATSIVLEFFKGAKQIAAKNQMNLALAAVELTHRNTRRYGGYLVHMGIVLMFIGFTGAAFNQNRVDEMKPGDSVTLGSYRLTLKNTNEGQSDNYLWQNASIAVTKNSADAGVLTPESRMYTASRQPTHEVALRTRLNEDLYLNFAGINGNRAVIQSYIFPLVSWIWIGALTLVFGTLVALVPSKVKREYARTQVVGITRKHATVEK
ncbi:MAG TPA: heme lyase CcmF/NrfE family subunit [Bryobacteraceae bacterium]|nr:heme lyase CcmF/NrfE family subunit [Bryobacteraceae bacterium]